MKTGYGRGYGKVILFNEHFVVYGIPAIATAIDKVVEARVEESDKLEIVDERPMRNRNNNTLEFEILKRIGSKIGIDVSKERFRITLKSEIPLGSGLGVSAATCVAIVRSVSDYFDLMLNDEEINMAAYEGEKVYHGNPSGIDNSVATFGKTIWYEKRDGGYMEYIKLGSPLYLVIGNTGILSDTRLAVESVRRYREKNRKKFDLIFEKSKRIVYDAKDALEEGNLKRIGGLMIENHKLLKEIGVSCKELDLLVDISLKNGALGAKLTGGGMGGNMIALAEDREMQDSIKEVIKERGFDAIKVEVL